MSFVKSGLYRRTKPAMSDLQQICTQQRNSGEVENTEVYSGQVDLTDDKAKENIDRIYRNDVTAEEDDCELNYGDSGYNTAEDSLLSSFQTNGSEMDDISFEPFLSTDVSNYSDLSDVHKLQEVISVLYLQSVSMKLKLRCVCDDLKSHASESDAIQSAVAGIEGILQIPSVLPNVLFPETAIEPASPVATVPVEETKQEEDTLEIVEALERAVNCNDDLVRALKSIRLISPAEEEDLRSRLQILYRNNVILTSIIDSSNVHTFEMSSLLSQKSDEVFSLRDELAETRSELNTLSLQCSRVSLAEVASRRGQSGSSMGSMGDAMESAEGHEREVEEKLKALIEANRSLRQEVRRLRVGELISTKAGEFSSANPNAIAACIQGLVARLALAEAKAETAERRLRMEKLKEKESNDDRLQAELQSARRSLSEKDRLLQQCQKRVERMKKNEKIYKRAVSDLRLLLEERQRELTEVYSFLHK